MEEKHCVKRRTHAWLPKIFLAQFEPDDRRGGGGGWGEWEYPIKG